MENQLLVSVIIPTYNREKLLPRAIDSVVNQLYRDWELIIVDDRSTDNTEALVKEYIQKDQRIKYVKNTHKQGPAGARNQGIEATKGEYVAFLDSDDEWKDCHLKETIDEFEKNKDVDWIYADGEIFKDGEKIAESVFREKWKGRDRIKTIKRDNLWILNGKNALTDALRYGTYAGCQSSVMRRAMFETIKFDETFYYGGVEDRLTPLEAIAKGFKLAYINRVHITHHVHKDSISASVEGKPINELLDIFNELERLYKVMPERLSLDGGQRHIVNKQLADLYFWNVGYNCYMKNNDYALAREYFLKGLNINPFNLRYWKAYVKNIIWKRN